MKRLKTHIALSAIIAAALLFICSSTQAQEKTNSKHSIDAFVSLTANFVTIPDAPPYTAEGYGTICYELDKKGALIKGESLPTLKFVAIDPPADLNELAIVVEGIPGTEARLDWEMFPIIDLTDLDLRVRAFNAKAEHRPHADSIIKPLVDIILSDLSFTTGSIEVEGVKAEGYIDAEKLKGVLVGKTTLPEHDYDLYNEWLAGQEVLLELTVQMKNPYKKQ